MNVPFSSIYDWLGGSAVKTGPINYEAILNPALNLSADTVIELFNKTPDINSLIGCPYLGNTIDLSGVLASIHSAKFKNNGTRLYVLRQATSTIFQFNLSVAYDITFASSVGSLSISGVVGTAEDFDISEDGTKMIVLGQASANTLYEYSLSTPFLISSGAYQSRSFSINGQDTQMRHIKLSKNGLRLLSFGDANDSIFQYTLGSLYNLTSVTYNTSLNLSSIITNPTFTLIRGFTAGNNGTRLLVAYSAASGAELIREIHLSDDLLLSGSVQGQLTRVRTASGGNIRFIEATDTINDSNYGNGIRNDILFSDTATPAILKELVNLKAKKYWFHNLTIGIRQNGSLTGEVRLSDTRIRIGSNQEAYGHNGLQDYMVFSQTQDVRQPFIKPLGFISDKRTVIEAVLFSAAQNSSVFNMSVGYTPLL